MSELEHAAKPSALLIVDDDPGVRKSLQRLLRRGGYSIQTAADAMEALQVLAKCPVHVLISDHMMPGMSGAELLARAKELYPEVIRIMLSGYANPEEMQKVVTQTGVFDFLSKPWCDEHICKTVHDAFEQYNGRHAPPEFSNDAGQHQ